MATGTAVGQAQGAVGDAEITKFFLARQQQERDRDLNLALRVREQDIQQRQFNQSLAAQDARQQQLLYANEAQRQAQLAAAQMREEYDLVAQQQEQMFAYQAQAAKSLDEQVHDAVKASQQMKLNPEGQRILNEKMGRLREVQQYSTSARPGVYADLMNQWLADFNQAGLDAYSIQEPSAQEEAYSNLVPLGGQQILPGQPLQPGDYLFPVSVRNGVKSWKQITIPNSQQLPFAEDIAKNTSPAPDGGFFYKQPDGKIAHIPPPKPEKPAAPPKPVDTSKYLREAVNQLRTEHQLSQTGDTPTAFKFDLDAAKARARELMLAEQELQAELGGTAETEAVPVSSPEEAMQLDVGQVFMYNGQRYRVTGPGEAEPL